MLPIRGAVAGTLGKCLFLLLGRLPLPQSFFLTFVQQTCSLSFKPRWLIWQTRALPFRGPVTGNLGTPLFLMLGIPSSPFLKFVQQTWSLCFKPRLLNTTNACATIQRPKDTGTLGKCLFLFFGRLPSLRSFFLKFVQQTWSLCFKHC